MSKTFSAVEPAERPLTVALSDTEVMALVNWHINMSNRTIKVVGKKLLTLRAKSLFPTKRESDALIQFGREQCEAHLQRAKGLQSILNTNETETPKQNDSTK